MTLLLTAIGILTGSGILSLAVSRSPYRATALGVGGALAGAALGLVPAVLQLGGGPTESVHFPWPPYGSFQVELDALSAFFIIPILGMTSLAAIYGSQYLQAFSGRKQLGPSWCFYNLLTASMVMVVIARNGVLFLVAWETMSLSSFFLVMFENEKEKVRKAGWTYLVAMHLGTVFLLLLFVLLGSEKGTLAFADFRPGGIANVLFLLAVIGFGTKAGFLPLHVWLPEAHPAAPSHVSAVMSGVMIKTGIYGLIRVLTFLGPPPAWWGWLLIGIGLSSGVLGILFALAQHDLKRLLAYSSVENIGIIAFGLGTGLLGLSSNLPALAVLGFAGGLLHVVNHTIFKGLLFLGAGAVLHGAGTAKIDDLGGLLKRMPVTAAVFLTGAVAISGLPPLNGFISEFLIYLGAFHQELTPGLLGVLPSLAVIAGLALIGGLAAACFIKAFGIVFLGEPRSPRAAQAQSPGWLMQAPMLVLAAGCVLGGLLAPLYLPALAPVVQAASGMKDEVQPVLAGTVETLTIIVLMAAGLVVLASALAWWRARLLGGREVGKSETWACGYARPTARMQYTASSFVQPLTELFAPLLRTRKKEPELTEYFPREKSLHTHTPDVWSENFYRPVFLAAVWGLSRLRWLQHGRVQLYVLYIVLTILFLLVWYLGSWA